MSSNCNASESFDFKAAESRLSKNQKKVDSIISVTEAAAKKIQSLVAKRDKPTLGIRVGVKSGGCSGLEYTFEYADSKNPLDEEIIDKGVCLFIESRAVLYLIGTVLDFQDGELKSGFVFINPNEKGRCGCGESFYS